MVDSIGRGPVECPRPPSDVSKRESEAKGIGRGVVCGKGPMKLGGGVRGPSGAEACFVFLEGTLRCLGIWAGTGVGGTGEISTPYSRVTAGNAAVVRASTIVVIFVMTKSSCVGCAVGETEGMTASRTACSVSTCSRQQASPFFRMVCNCLQRLEKEL